MTAILKFWSSLRLTVVTLAMAMGLVFIGTLAQVKIGLYQAQIDYFQSLFVWWGPSGSNWKIPVWPGGYLLGLVLLINLLAAHASRFKFSKKKIGIFVIHAGLIILFLGQFATERLSVESNMVISEGASKNYSENGRKSELAIIETTDSKEDVVTSVPEAWFGNNRELNRAELPFIIKVQMFAPNAEPAAKGSNLVFTPLPPATKMNDRNIPAAEVEVVDRKGKSLAKFETSNWLSEDKLLSMVKEKLGERLSPSVFQRSEFKVDGRSFELAMRPVRYYKPYVVQLLNFSHDRYAGTDIPKNYSSRIRLINSQTREDREVLIYMNNPLRYGGETYYQASFLPGDTGTIFQVVKNPGWLTPYLACIMVSAGLLIQFLTHLIQFIKKRRTA